MSEVALELIAGNKETRDPSLDLGMCGLTELPREIGELVWIESLSLSSRQEVWDGEEWRLLELPNPYYGDENEFAEGFLATGIETLLRLKNLRKLFLSGVWITDLFPFSVLPSLETLDISNTPVIDLSPLARLASLRDLNIKGNRVTNLAPLAHLTDLQSLHLGATRIRNLAPLFRLRALRALNLFKTQITDLAPLSNLTALQALNVSETSITSIAPLRRLTTMQKLDLFGTAISELAPLARMKDLRSLDASHTPVNDLAPLADLSALRSLNVQNTQIVDLAPLAGLSALQTLNIRDTQIAQLTPLSGLAALHTINASHTPVSDLSPLTSLIRGGVRVRMRSPERPDGIIVEDCPLTNPPSEIVHQGNEAILNYFRERESGVDHLYEAKMLILGEGGAGKTSLLRRLFQPDLPLPTEKETTRGIAIHRHEFPLKNGRRFRLNVWDFGGQEIYHATHQFFLTRRSLYLLVDDTRKDHKSVSDEGFKYWLELVDVFGGRSPVLIFQNEKGGRSKAIDISGIRNRFENVKERYGGNLENPDAASELGNAIEFYASGLSHIGEELPARWIGVRRDIEKRSDQVPYISLQEYFEMYRGHMEFDRAKALHLSRYLHDLGVFLHFQDDLLLAQTVILQNQWATEAVFRVLDDEVIKAKLGRFNAIDCGRLWHDSIYADMHPQLLALMMRFELCYELHDSNPLTWLAPQLLPPAKPAELSNWAQPGELVLRYQYDFLPKGMISRLIVRLHRFVRDTNTAWNTGVLFEQGGTYLLAEILPTGTGIELRARGPEAHGLLSIVSADLDALNDSFPGLRGRVDKSIPCNCDQCRAAATAHFFPHKALLKRKEDNRLKVECPHSYADVDVLELLDGVRFTPSASNRASALLRVIRIFLASSSELRDDRDAFELYFLQQNSRLRHSNVFLEVVRWENFLDAVSDTRLQDEYNKEIRACDLFVSLFFTKTGKYTEEEFDVAHRQFKETAKPAIYTYFKTADVNIDAIPLEDFTSLRNFQKKLSDLGHFYTRYKNTEDLKLQVAGQIEKLLNSGAI